MGEMCEGDQKTQTSRYKIHGNVTYSVVTMVNNIVVHIIFESCSEGKC